MPRILDRFTIRRTESELGYTYWVLQGRGKFCGFTYSIPGKKPSTKDRQAFVSKITIVGICHGLG